MYFIPRLRTRRPHIGHCRIALARAGARAGAAPRARGARCTVLALLGLGPRPPLSPRDPDRQADHVRVLPEFHARLVYESSSGSPAMKSPVKKRLFLIGNAPDEEVLKNRTVPPLYFSSFDPPGKGRGTTDEVRKALLHLIRPSALASPWLYDW